MTQVLGRGALASDDQWIKDLATGDHHLYWLKNATVSEEVLPHLEGEAELKRVKVMVGDDFVYTEEILSQLLAKARQYATAEAGAGVKDCVITVPYYWSHAQRQALLDAANLAGFNVLSLLNQNMAIALKFMTDRDFADGPANVVFYDMGTSDLQVSVYRFESQKGKGKTKWVNNATLLATASDSSLGGSAFDSKVVNMWVDKLKAKFGADFVLPPQAMTKLQKQAKKTKEILSANKETQAAIESLLPDYDFRASVTREEFERQTDELVVRSLAVLKTAIEDAGLTPAELNLFEMFGGGARIPKIQDALKAYLNMPLSRHLNTDEAAAFGAAIFAASKSSQHKVKEFNAKEGSHALYPILVRATDEAGKSLVADDSGIPIADEELDRVLYKDTARLGSRRTLKIKTDKDIFIELKYPESVNLESGVSHLIARHKLSLPKDLNTRLNITDTPTAHIRFELTSSGTVLLTSADAQVPIVRQKVVTVRSEKKVDEEKKAEDAEKKDDTETASDEASTAESTEEETAVDAETDSTATTTDETAETVDDETKEEVEEEEPKTEIRYIHTSHTVKLVQEPLAVIGLTEAQLSEARQRLKVLDDEEKVRLETEHAKSDLEALIYHVYDKLEDSESVKHSTSSEREALSEALGVAANWLEAEGAETIKADYVDRKAELNKLWTKITARVSETKEIPHSIGLCRKAISTARIALVTISEVRNVTESEITLASDAIDRVETFLNTTEEDFAALAPTDDPKTLSSDVNMRCREFSWRIDMLSKKPRKMKPKPAPTTSTDNKTSEETTAETAEPAENSEPIEPATDSSTETNTEEAKEEL